MCGAKLWFLEQFNFKATKIEIFNEEKCALETINLTNENIDNVNMLLLVKYNISDAVFKELSQLCNGMPTFYSISKSIKELNEGVNVFDTPGSSGVQVSFNLLNLVNQVWRL